MKYNVEKFKLRLLKNRKLGVLNTVLEAFTPPPGVNRFGKTD